MVETTFQSYDPLPYYVNNVSDLDKDVVSAHKDKNQDEKRRLLAIGDKCDYDLYICINKSNHAFLLCIPVKENIFEGERDPSKVPDLVLCWKFELCYEHVELKMYKIRKQHKEFKDFRSLINRSYYVGRYLKLPVKGFDFAALASAPHRYGVLIGDCVEFSKEFCLCLLSYCSNGISLEKTVNERIQKASATGLSIERLSRTVKSSGFLGNFFLGGIDMSSFIGSRYFWIALGLFLCFLLVYPILIAILIVWLLK